MPMIGRTTNARSRMQKFLGTGSDKIFSLDFIPQSDHQMMVYIQGVYQDDHSYVFKHPNKIFFADTPSDGAEITVVAIKSADYQSHRTNFFRCDGVQRIFNLGYTPPNEQSILVTKNGDILQDKDYVLQGNKIVMTHTPAQGVELETRALYDIIDPSGNAQASNSLSIQRTRQTADGYQNIFPMHQKPSAENNLLVFRGSGNHSSIVSNDSEYAIVNEYKYVHNNVLPDGEELEFRGLTGSTYSNLNRRVITTTDVDGVPAAISVTSGGTSGYSVANNLETTGGSGTGFRVNITSVSSGTVTGVSINTDLGAGTFARNYNSSEVLTIKQSGSTNDATITIGSVTNSTGQRYFDINNHIFDVQNNAFQKETSYVLSADEQDLLVSVDGIIQPYNQYTVMAADFNEGSGSSNQIVDIGSVVGHSNNPANVEIRDLKELVSNADVVLDADTGIERAIWTTTGGGTTFTVGNGSSTVETSNFATAMGNDASNEHKFMVLVNGIIQDEDTWSISGGTLTVGAAVGSSDDSGAGQSVFVELIFFTGLDSSNQNAKQVTMTGNAQTGAGDHKFIRLYDRATGLKELHPSSDACVIVDINGVYQNDRTYFVKNNKLCFYDEFPAFGSEINVKILKCTEVVAANRRKDMRRGDGSTTTFSLPFNSTTTPKDIGYHISVNGKVLRDNEFSINTAGTVVTFSTAPANDAFIEIVGIFDITTFAGSSSDTDLDIRKKVFDCDGVRQLFDLGDLVFERHAFGTVQDSYNEQKLLVFINGELQSNDKYIIVGSRLYMTTVPGGSDVLEVIRFI